MSYVAQLVAHLTAGTCLTADPEAASLSSAQSETFEEIDHEIILRYFSLPLIQEGVVVSCKRKYVHGVLVNCLVKLALEKIGVRQTDRPDITIAGDWDVKHQIKQKQTAIHDKCRLLSHLFTVKAPNIAH